MKLLKFVDADAPQTGHGAKWNGAGSTLTFPKLPGGWQGTAVPAPGSYWLIDDAGKPTRLFEEVVVMRRVTTVLPKGITDDDVKDVDFRSRMGKQLESTRLEYGQTFKTAASKAAAMNQEELRAKRLDTQKREREEIAGAIERGEALPEKGRSKGSRKEAAAASQPEATATPTASQAEKKPTKSKK